MRLNKFFLPLLAGLILSLFCSGCGGGRDAETQAAPAGTPQSSTPAAIEAPLSLLSRLERSASAGRTTVLASQYSPELPSSRIEVQAEQLTFSPAGTAIGHCAYAFYALDASGFNGSWSLYYEWSQLPSFPLVGLHGSSGEGPYELVLNDGDDNDFYRIDGLAGQTLHLEARISSGSPWLLPHVYDCAGTLTGAFDASELDLEQRFYDYVFTSNDSVFVNLSHFNNRHQTEYVLSGTLQ